MNLFALMDAVSKAQAAGQQLSNPLIWSNRAKLTATFVILLNVCVGMLNTAGIDVGIPATDLATIAQAVSIVAVYVSNKLHIASNVSAGK